MALFFAVRVCVLQDSHQTTATVIKMQIKHKTTIFCNNYRIVWPIGAEQPRDLQIISTGLFQLKLHSFAKTVALVSAEGAPGSFWKLFAVLLFDL